MYRSSNATYGSHYRGHSVNPKSSSLVSNKPKGLENLTNTCYISAVLQILFLILPETLVKHRGPITQLYFKLKQSKSVSDYKTFKRSIQRKIQIVQGYQQQDAQQFLISFLELLNQQNCQGLKRSSRINLDYNEKGGIEDNHKNFVSEMLKIQNSKIIELFSAELVNKFTCEKGHLKFKFQRYQCLSLNFPQTSQTTTSLRYTTSSVSIELVQLIKKHVSKQLISGLLCQKCKRRTEFTKQLFIYSTPKYFFIHLARFKHGHYSSQKISTTVEYDEFLEIFDQTLQNRVKYRLLGTINHYGTLNRGHYYAEVRWRDGHWYQINDEDVRSCRIDTTGNRSKYVYILCYEKM